MDAPICIQCRKQIQIDCQGSLPAEPVSRGYRCHKCIAANYTNERMRFCSVHIVFLYIQAVLSALGVFSSFANMYNATGLRPTELPRDLQLIILIYIIVDVFHIIMNFIAAKGLYNQTAAGYRANVVTCCAEVVLGFFIGLANGWFTSKPLSYGLFTAAVFALICIPVLFYFTKRRFLFYNEDPPKSLYNMLRRKGLIAHCPVTTQEKKVVIQPKQDEQTSKVPSPSQKPEILFCRKCGARLSSDGDFCAKCGTKIERSFVK